MAEVTGRGQGTRMALSRLGPRDLLAMLTECFGSARLAEELGMRIAVKSDGNPFFVLEIVRSLKESPLLRRHLDGTWAATQDIRDIEIPSGVLDLIRARLRDLDGGGAGSPGDGVLSRVRVRPRRARRRARRAAPVRAPSVRAHRAEAPSAPGGRALVHLRPPPGAGGDLPGPPRAAARGVPRDDRGDAGARGSLVPGRDPRAGGAGGLRAGVPRRTGRARPAPPRRGPRPPRRVAGRRSHARPHAPGARRVGGVRRARHGGNPAPSRRGLARAGHLEAAASDLLHAAHRAEAGGDGASARVAHAQRGDVLARLGRTEEAETVLRAVLAPEAAGEDDLGRLQARTALGALRQSQGAMAEAETLFRDAGDAAARLGRRETRPRRRSTSAGRSCSGRATRRAAARSNGARRWRARRATDAVRASPPISSG